MNFLSHYYFDRTESNPYIILGGVLPDLVRNSLKNGNLHPQKKEALFTEKDELNILYGWKRHLKVDSIFHSSPFFFSQTAILKQHLLPLLIDTPVRPSFLAHIALELLLDHILADKGMINIDKFYQHLESIDKSILTNFLNKSGIKNGEAFQHFFNGFKSSKYLFNYQKIDSIGYALQRICMRLWPRPFKEETVMALTGKLAIYKPEIEKKFMLIFEEIEIQLNS